MVKTEAWVGTDAEHGVSAVVEAERTDPDEVALFVYADSGERVSLYWSATRATEVARQLLNAASPSTDPS